MVQGTWAITVEGDYWSDADKEAIRQEFDRFLSQISSYSIPVANLEFTPSIKKGSIFWHPV